MNGTKKIVILQDGGAFRVIISGRANFEYGRDLREELARKKIIDKNSQQIRIDLAGCSGMDSTFMGILAMLALEAKKFDVQVIICDNKPHNICLLEDLGIAKLFTMEQCGTECACGEEIPAEQQSPEEDKELATAEAVVDAHQTLMDVEDKNKEKFNMVVDMAKQDLEKVRKAKLEKEKKDKK